jgi:hypothetical protein
VCVVAASRELLLDRLLSDYAAGRLGPAASSPDGRPKIGVLVAAIAKGEHGAGVTQDVWLADEDFVATDKTRKVTNDSQVTIPDGTRLYIARVRPLPGWRIPQGFKCAP